MLETLSIKAGVALEEAKLSPNLQKRFAELVAMRGFLDRTRLELNRLGRTQFLSRRRVILSGLLGLALTALGMVASVLLVPGMIYLGLSAVLYFRYSLPIDRSLARKRKELQSITVAFEGAVGRTAKEAARDAVGGWR